MRGHALSMVSRASDVILFENLLYEYDTCSVTDNTIFVFSRDVTAAMLLYPTNPLGIELYYQANVFFCFVGKTRLLTTLGENDLQPSVDIVG